MKHYNLSFTIKDKGVDVIEKYVYVTLMASIPLVFEIQDRGGHGRRSQDQGYFGRTKEAS